jgi:hypothetical protein
LYIVIKEISNNANNKKVMSTRQEIKRIQYFIAKRLGGGLWVEILLFNKLLKIGEFLKKGG